MSSVTIIPGIIEEDEQLLEERISQVSPYCGWVQIVVSDGTMDAPKTALSTSIIQKFPHTNFEAHIVAAKPETFVRQLALAGYKRIVAHVECIDPREFIAEARSYDCEVGLAIDVDSDIDTIEPLLEDLDFVLVMGTQAGMKGLPYEETTREKIQAIHRNFPDLPIAVQGGMMDTNVQAVVEAGATRIISTSFIFTNSPAVEDALEQLTVLTS